LRFLKSFALVLLLGLLRVPPAAAQFPPAPGTGPGLPETIEAIDSARVTTRILYITAHPDDESAAVLTYLARGLHADVALLSITRGEGGQNALGPEQAPQLGLIRTQELLAATRGYGVKLYFTRARDFGYSKTPEETERIWGDQVLEDMVRVIRSFRPNIVINHWGGVHSGHGHHQASGLLTPKAVQLAAEDNAYTELLTKEGLGPCRPFGELPIILDVERSDKPSGYVLPLDEVSPLYGKTWREIGLDAFVNHRTQGIAGFLNSPFLRRPISLKREDGKPLDPRDLASPLTAIDSGGAFPASVFQPDLQAAAEAISDARSAALKLHWKEAASSLAFAAKKIEALALLPEAAPISPPAWYDLEFDLEHIQKAMKLVAGLQITAESDRGEVVAGEAFHVDELVRCRPEASCTFSDPKLGLPHGWTSSNEKTETPARHRFAVIGTSQPRNLPVLVALTGEPWPIAELQQPLTISDYSFTVNEPVTFLEAHSTAVANVPLQTVPAYTLAVEPQQAIEIQSAGHKPFDIFLRVHSYSTKAANVTVGLDVPDGLHASSPVELAFDGIGDQYAKFTVTPPAKLDPGDFTITPYAKRGDETFSTSLEPLPSMPSILWSEPAQCIVHAFDINVPPHLRVGYISAEGEPIPDALKRLGITVDMLDANALAFGNLSIYDAIGVGVRAYELRPELTGANKRLLDYVSSGGTLVVQYNRDFVWDKLQPAPYPAKIGNPNPRVTDESADVRFLQPNDALLNSPNKITAADFKNWVQERGLYFWSNFDPRYTPLLAMHDPGETDLNGGLVYTRYGQGTYIYTGLSFFRQLPEGVSGAYRLFVNLISASRTSQPAAAH
jgi:LmbE family N-acetylglucosaminyl deacetylase